MGWVSSKKNCKNLKTICLKILKFFIFLLCSSFFYSQSIPIEHNQFKLYDLRLDRGVNWENNSMLYGPRWQDFKVEDRNSDSIITSIDIFNFNAVNENQINSGFGISIRTSFYKHFYTSLYARFANKENAFDRYSGIPRKTERFGLSTGEVDISGFGFDNDKFNFEMGRGRLGLGSGDTDIQLSLNQEGPSYDYLSFGVNITNWRIRFINGYLETKNNVNRYISVRSIEKILKKNLLISFSETVIYSGENRPLDFAYLNPISTHLEIELNDRQNLSGTASGNAIWETSLDWLINKRSRLSINIVIDEFVLDKVQLDQGKIHSMGWALRFCTKPILDIPNTAMYLSIVNTGTYLYKHENGYNNFVQRGNLLGYEGGNDLKKISLGLTSFDLGTISYRLELSSTLVGESSILNDLYHPYFGQIIGTGKFPSGENKRRNVLLFSYCKSISDLISYNIETKIIK